jgi:hypothetical protein
MSHALRIRGRVVVSPTREEVGWAERRVIDPALSTAARELLAAAWLRIARDEHASVPAYAKISTSLVALGAPRELIEACHRAALDEIDHARRAFSLASAYAGRTFGPGMLEALLRPERDARDTAALLRRLALETLEDGCLAEAFAAELAEEGAANATDAEVKATLATIARGEAEHCELAWRILYWCCSVGDGALRRAVRAKLDELPRMIMPLRVDPRIADELARHGQLSAERKRLLFAEVRQDLIVRVLRILDGLDARAVGFAAPALVEA